MEENKQDMIFECITYRSQLKEKYTTETNTINYYFWPKDAIMKKKLKNNFSLLAVTVSTLIILSIVAFLLKDMALEYRLGLVGVGIVLVGATIFFIVKNKKKYNALKDEWNKRLAVNQPVKEKIQELEDVVCTNIIEEVCYKEYQEELSQDSDSFKKYFELTKEKLAEEVGLTSDDLIEYYKVWVEK